MSDSLAAERDELHRAVGECILAWSYVELHLSIIFEEIVGTSRPVSHAALSAVRSFEARLKMIGDAFAARFADADDELRVDWKLIYNQCSSLNALRNQVAHATELLENGVSPVLEPFFSMTSQRTKIYGADITQRTKQFHELAEIVTWMVWAVTERLRPGIGFQQPPPDLLLRLRSEAAQRRAKHGRPPQSPPR